MEIKSLTHLKKSLKVGDTVVTTFHLKSKGYNPSTNLNEYCDEVRPPRKVAECNSSSFSLITGEGDDKHLRNIKYPKASTCCIDNGDLIIMGVDVDNPENKKPIKWLTISVL